MNNEFETHTDETDPDEAWMRSHARLPVVNQDFRARALASTTNTLRRRRWTQRSMIAAAAIVLVAAGIAVVGGAPGEAPQIAQAPDVSQPDDAIVINLNDPESVPRALASATPEQKAAILRAVGDTIVHDRDDPSAALPYYRQYLAALPLEEQIRVRDDDTWLLAQLKQARSMEVRYAQQDE